MKERNNYQEVNRRMRQLQEDFLTTGNPSAWAGLWLLSLEICGNIIAGEQARKNFRLTHEDIQDKTINAVLYVLRRYRTRKNYRINNFLSALKFGVKHSLYYQTMESYNYDRHLNTDTLSGRLPYFPKRIVYVHTNRKKLRRIDQEP